MTLNGVRKLHLILSGHSVVLTRKDLLINAPQRFVAYPGRMMHVKHNIYNVIIVILFQRQLVIR